MIIGVGTDIFSISRLKALENIPDDPFFTRAFTEAERTAATLRADPLRYYAARFAGKEAVYKAISSCGCGCAPGDIEIAQDENERPGALLRGKTAECLRAFIQSKVRLHLSLSNDGEYATAFAIAEIENEEVHS